MRTTHLILTVSLFIFVLLAGCGSSAAEQPLAFTPTGIPRLESPSQTPFPSLTTEPANTQQSQMGNFLDNLGGTQPTSPLDPFVNLAKQDLANRLKINADQITSLKATEITWPDITQGCDAASSQTLSKGKVSGYRIWLQANGENFAYHVGLDGKVFQCPK